MRVIQKLLNPRITLERNIPTTVVLFWSPHALESISNKHLGFLSQGTSEDHAGEDHEEGAEVSKAKRGETEIISP